MTIRGTLHAIDLAGGAITAVATRVMGGSHNGHEPKMTPVTQTPPDTRTPQRRPTPQRRRTRTTAATPTATPDTPSGPDAPPGHEAPPSTEGPPAPEPPPAEPALDAEGPPAPEPPPAEPGLDAEGPASTPEPPSDARRLAAETGDQPSDPFSAEPAHVSEEPELVEEFAEPGAEEGAGAQLRIIEPWDGYNEMKAADIIERLGSASREELATVELYELAGRNRKSVVAAAQRALRQASPPR